MVTAASVDVRRGWIVRTYLAWEKAILGALGIVGFVALWELASAVGVINPLVLSSPSRVVDSLRQQAESGMLWNDTLVSLSEVGIAFAIAALLGVAIGTLMAVSKVAEYALDPFVWAVYTVPVVALVPLLIIWLGFGKATVIAVAVMIAIVPIIVNTSSGVTGANPTLLQAADAFGASPWTRARKVLLPSAVPLILAGFRLAVGKILVGVVIGEMFSSNAGLGYRMTYYGQLVRAADVLVPMMTIVAIGVIATQLIRVVEDRTQAWRS